MFVDFIHRGQQLRRQMLESKREQLREKVSALMVATKALTVENDRVQGQLEKEKAKTAVLEEELGTLRHMLQNNGQGDDDHNHVKLRLITANIRYKIQHAKHKQSGKCTLTIS